VQLKPTRITAVFLASCCLASWTAAQQPSPEIGYKSAENADQKKTLLLKDFKPTAMLHAPVHKVDRARYYVIDVHNHVNDAQGIDDPIPPQRVIQVMDKTNVKTVVILTGMGREVAESA
jgi:hypothetical protein